MCMVIVHKKRLFMERRFAVVCFCVVLLFGCTAHPTPSAVRQPISTVVIPEFTPTTESTSIPKPTFIPTPVVFTGCTERVLRVRSAPGTDNEILGRLTPLHTGEEDSTVPMCVPVIERNDDASWVMVSYDGGTGWVSAAYIAIQGDANQLPVVGEDHFSPTQETKPLPPDDILCKDTRNWIGSYVTCKVPHVYCSYEPSISGSPTYCDNAPYPDNSFTLVALGKDWRDLDGSCILVSGTITLYLGKLRIEAGSRSQISTCP